jgi:hypothetical protein
MKPMKESKANTDDPRREKDLASSEADANGWPKDMEKWFSGAFGDLELPDRPKDSRNIPPLVL